jgi:hypothetical protein
MDALRNASMGAWGGEEASKRGERQWRAWAMGWVTGISEMCVISLQRTYKEDWSRYMVGPSHCSGRMFEFSVHKRLNDPLKA